MIKSLWILLPLFFACSLERGVGGGTDETTSGQISGILVDGHLGRRMDGVLVKIYPSDSVSRNGKPVQALDSAVTDANGQYLFNKIPQGTYSLEAEYTSPSDTLGLVVQNLVQKTSTHRLFDTLKSPGALSGKVVLGQPSQQVYVSIPGTSYLTLADSNGTYTLANIPPGTYRLSVTRIGAADTLLPPIAVQSTQTTVVPEIVNGAVPAKPQNVALRASVTAQSTYPGYSPSNITDGDTNTAANPANGWSNSHLATTDGQIPQWVIIDLGAAFSISSFNIRTAKAWEISDFDIELWTGAAWTPVQQIRGNTATVFSVPLATPVTASKVRLIGRQGPASQNIYVRFNEVEVMGTSL